MDYQSTLSRLALALAVVGVVGCCTSPPTAAERWREGKSYHALYMMLKERVESQQPLTRTELRHMVGDLEGDPLILGNTPGDWQMDDREWVFESKTREPYRFTIRFSEAGELASAEWE